MSELGPKKLHWRIGVRSLETIGGYDEIYPPETDAMFRVTFS
jgi:hypothetical protein